MYSSDMRNVEVKGVAETCTFASCARNLNRTLREKSLYCLLVTDISIL
jgi:hypothetical protein